MIPHEKSKPQLMIHRKVMSMIKSPNIIASITIIHTTGENYRCSQMTQTPAKSAEFFFCTTSLTVPATSPKKKQKLLRKSTSFMVQQCQNLRNQNQLLSLKLVANY